MLYKIHLKRIKTPPLSSLAIETDLQVETFLMFLSKKLDKTKGLSRKLSLIKGSNCPTVFSPHPTNSVSLEHPFDLLHFF